ncbi:unnamed protein product [Prunus armeniaca]|uniref:Uncharacterized protein n=1 Tax=Prunus armeniaca TaxID=36596 RepID=A0A6J5TH56_PRUAR|nr:unnamed protein product [Prunus armeniaca]CAB4292601.1 unnamed protein product [Prunus armeniaca]
MEVKTSPPMNIKMVKMMSWALEKTSISTVDMLETVEAETEVKNKSKFLGRKEGSVLDFKALRTPKPRKERVTK